MSGGGGDGPKLIDTPTWDEIKNRDYLNDFKNDPVGTYRDIMEGITTLPIRSTLRAGDELLGEVSGRNMQREQLYLAEKRLQEEARRRDEELRNQRKQDELMDIAASEAAGGGRRAGGRGRASLSYDSQTMNKDFLGL